MTTVLVSGCYDLLHAGHLRFFADARALGDRLAVSVASDETIAKLKHRMPALQQAERLALISALRQVDYAEIGAGPDPRLDFATVADSARADVLAATTDDKYAAEKKTWCANRGIPYVSLAKAPAGGNSSTSIRRRIAAAPESAPLRVDLAGGWLDVPKLARAGGHIVNCAISPLVAINNWQYRLRAGIGGSAAWATLHGRSALACELNAGVGWQDPAILAETGLCSWRSGPSPRLHAKRDGSVLGGRMLLVWTGAPHDTPSLVSAKRNYRLIAGAGKVATAGVLLDSLWLLAKGISLHYRSQIGEGMQPLPELPGQLACKYCGSGWGGYALYLFPNRRLRAVASKECSEFIDIEPYWRAPT